MSDQPNQNPDRDELLVEHLAAGKSKTEAGRLSSMSPATVRRRLADPDLKRRVTTRRGELLEDATGGLAAATVAAVECLRSLLQAESEQVRMGASLGILKTATTYRESTELVARIEKLEQRERDREHESAKSSRQAGAA